MSELLDLAREQAEAVDYEPALKTLEEVKLLARHDLAEAHGLLDLAVAIKGKGDRRLRRQCEYLSIVAEQTIRSFECDLRAQAGAAADHDGGA